VIVVVPTATKRPAQRARGRIRVVTISAACGALGEHVVRSLEHRLGYGVLDASFPRLVAERVGARVEDALALDERAPSRLAAAFTYSGWIGMTPDGGCPVEVATITQFRTATEQVIREAAGAATGAEGAGVIIVGRAAAQVLADRGDTLKVRVTGPAERRARQLAALEGTDIGSARRRVRQVDRLASGYVRHYYLANIDDPMSYDMVLDTTSIAADTCASIVADTVRSER
jgi:Cytidylate kinase-like family